MWQRASSQGWLGVGKEGSTARGPRQNKGRRQLCWSVCGFGVNTGSEGLSQTKSCKGAGDQICQQFMRQFETGAHDVPATARWRDHGQAPGLLD